MEKILLLLYAIPFVFICSYSLVQLSLIRSYLRASKTKKPTFLPLSSHENLPFVSIQLPIYNEIYVVERLLDATAAINYPIDKFEIQVLDDSNDETVEIIDRKVKKLQGKGIQIQHIRRENRQGFKAGALAYGLSLAKGEFIALFDADFVPPKNFLEQTIGYFQDSSVGVVQTRWGHLNENYSLLTQLQAFGLDAHFSVEQEGRSAAHHFINFNGTAGIWRKTAIADAGGWQADTLTEDLDLSYRAQMKSWKFVYLKEIVCPAELPISMNAIKSQQYRWAKGAAECSKKNLHKLFTTNNLSLSTKIHGFYHLMNSALFVAIILLALVGVPLLLLDTHTPFHLPYSHYLFFFQISWLVLGIFYWVAYQDQKSGIFNFLKRFLLFLLFMMGLSLHNAFAVVEAWLGIKTPFIRTPKFNSTQQNKWQNNKYLPSAVGKFVWLEIVLFLYCLVAIFLELSLKSYGMLVFYSMLAIGLGLVLFYTFKHARQT